ncbi:MAG: hypothetical protein ACKVY0_29365 [Prosthecobacter sp.]|uniref:hypothetical protein n=1 Tax=Prosthecobacter sp. TaxID=1965333 RepID=UPI003901CFF1
MKKPLHLLTPAEKAELVARMKEQFAAEEFFTGVLGNRHAVVLPRRRSRKVTANKPHTTVKSS